MGLNSVQIVSSYTEELIGNLSQELSTKNDENQQVRLSERIIVNFHENQ